MRILFLSGYSALLEALEKEAQRYPDLDILSASAQTQPLVLPDFDFLIVIPLGASAEVGCTPCCEQLLFWQERLLQLVELCSLRQARLILVSSDSVFAREQLGVSELDRPASTQPWALQQLALEAQAAQNKQNLLLRIPPLLSSDPEGGLARLVSRCRQHQAPDDLDYRGLQPVDDLARVLLGICLQLDAGAQASGIYHYAGTEPVSQTELMHTLARYLQTPAYPADPSGTNRQGINSQHLLETFGIHPRSWRSRLPVLLEELNALPQAH